MEMGTIMNAPKPSANEPQPWARQHQLQSVRAAPANIAIAHNFMLGRIYSQRFSAVPLFPDLLSGGVR
jgi:hypothetical protein